MPEEITFFPLAGDTVSLPFRVEAPPTRTFREVVHEAIRLMARSDESLLGHSFDVSTGSADIELDASDLDSNVSRVSEKYGRVFSVRLGTMLRVPD
ncbi:MAG: hypothetical protein ACTSU5_15735 [Promethearchaeota archaeon]